MPANTNTPERAVGWLPCEERNYPKASVGVGDEFDNRPQSFYAEASLQELLDACNNNVAYAYACVQLGLHKFIVTSSTKLQGVVKSFAHFVKRKQGPSVLPTLIRHNAPRILGDIFATSGAAVFVDSGWDKFEGVFQS